MDFRHNVRPIMTKKDFELIANAINRELKAERTIDLTNKGRPDFGNGVTGAAFAICHALRQANPRFDRELFLKACFDGTEAYKPY